MEQLARHHASRKGLKSHVTRLYNKIDALIDSEIDDYSIALLSKAMDQLKDKGDKLDKIDEEIVSLINDPHELEGFVIDSEELKDEISDKLTRVQTFINLHRHPKSTSPSPSLPQVSHQSVAENVNPSQSINTTHVDSQPQISSASLLSSPQLSGAATSAGASYNTELPHPVTRAPLRNSDQQTSETLPCISTPEAVATNNVMPPLLIPFTSVGHTIPHISQQSPLVPSVPDARDLYTSSESQFMNHRLPPMPTGGYHVNTQQFATSRLPKLSLPTFSGDPLTWQSFWDSFSAAIHSNHSISGVQKFTYLKAQLQGDAARAIDGLPLSDHNYLQSIELLQNRFGQPHKLINAHMQALMNMASPTSSLSSLRIFYDSIESHIRGLRSLGKSEHSYGDLLVPVIMARLTPEVRRNLAREHSSSQWVLSDLLAALQKEIRILESGLHDFSSSTSSKSSTTAALQVGARDKREPSSARTTKRKVTSCVFCKGPHPTYSCETVTDHQKRVDVVKRDNLCFNCLSHHKVSQCQSRFRCKKCGKKHHTTLCNSEPPAASESKAKVAESKSPSSSSAPSTTTTTTDVAELLTPASSYTPQLATTCLLKTAVAPVVTGNKKTSANILFDEGAQRSFICTDMVKELEIPSTSTANISLASFGTASRTHQNLPVTTVKIETANGELIPISTLVVPTIAAPIQNAVPIALSTMPYLQGLKLAHPVTSNKNFTIQILIGADYYWKFVQDTIIRGDGPIAQESKLGYLLSGPLPCSLSQSATSILLQMTSSVPPEEPNLENFWSIESVGTDTTKQAVNSTFLHAYQQSSITQTPEGMYVARFPWKEDKPFLPSNFSICQKRTATLLQKLQQSPDLLNIYDNIIKDQEERGFIERVDDNDTNDNTHYLPHRAVKKDSITTPIRIVYDCSCQGNGKSASLNDCLIAEPPFLNNLCAILIRFRCHAFAIATDIEKAFLHVKLHPDDRNFTRFLWTPTPESSTDTFITYRFTVVPFGSSSSPFMLAAVLDLHLTKVGSSIAQDMKENVYVDNILSGCNTEDELEHYYQQSRKLMSQANFNLRSWSSNSHRLQTVSARDKTSDPNPTVGLLGLRWNTMTDTISLAPRQLSPANTFVTKRDVLQTSSQIFDPLGFVTPVSVRAKILLQEIWQTKFTWDEPLSKEITDNWLSILPDLMKLSQFTIPRAYLSSPVTSACHLYAFSDASKKAYGAVVYVCQNQEVSLVMSKCRVAPIKTVTLPRLELMAAVVATRLVQFVKSAIHLQPNDSSSSIHMWTDSQIVLHWIYKSYNQSKPFISHRVSEIVRAFPANSWSFTPSEDNPADLLTRGISAQQLFSSEVWLHGPPWLLSRKDWPQWTPTNILLQLTEDDDHENPSLATESSKDVSGIHNIVDIARHSTIDKLLAVTAYVLRFILNSRKRQPALTGPLTATERIAAMKQWVSSTQMSSFPTEFAYLQKTHRVCPNLVKQLRLYLDKDNLLRCSGRIHNAPVSDSTKFPLLLPSKHQLTDMIIQDTHKKLHHGGVAVTVTAIRQVYWIPSIRQRVRSVLRRCVICAKTMGKPYRTPDLPPLPKVRVGEATPFAVTGVDFTGTLYVKESNGEHKAYICLFTCASTRAIHLEVVSDLSTESFMLAFRRFTSRRSLPSIMLSDNASTYLAAAEELKMLFESDDIKEAFGRQGVDWQFIPKRAPWYGGFWERLIGLTKQAIKKTLGRAFISLEHLQTIVVEIEGMMNDRPLTYMYSDLQDPQPLTPAHLLYGRRLQQAPRPLNDPEELVDPNFTDGMDLRNRVDKLTLLIQHFTSRWKREYLTSLREFSKLSKQNNQLIRTGDIVIVHDDNKPRLQWKLAIVEDLIKGKDGEVRAAHIRTSNYTTTRPISKLYPLEVHSEGSETASEEPQQSVDDMHLKDKEKDATTDSTITRVRRAAATRALEKMKEWSSVLGPPPEDV